MIHGSSVDPVYLKKISLNIWTLRDELEGQVSSKIENDQMDADSAVSAIEEQFHSHESNPEDESEISIDMQSPELDPSKVNTGRAILAEIHMDEIYFFCDARYIEGQTILLQFNVPRKFIITAKVVHCRQYNMQSRIIRNKNLEYRVCAEFTFARRGERTLLRNFLESIEIPASELKEAEVTELKPKKKQKNTEDDIFSELE